MLQAEVRRLKPLCRRNYSLQSSAPETAGSARTTAQATPATVRKMRFFNITKRTSIIYK